MNRSLDGLADAAVLLLATVVAARPWSWRTDQVFAQGDTAFTLAALDQIQRGFPGSSMLEAPLSWPFPHGTTQSDWVLGQALLAMPLRAAGVDPLLQHNVLVLLGLWTTAVAIAVVGRWLGLDRPSRLFAAIVGGLGPLQLGHAQHVNLVWHAPVVLGPAALYAGLSRDDHRYAAAGAAIVGLAWQFGIYLGMQATIAAIIVALTASGVRRVPEGELLLRDRRRVEPEPIAWKTWLSAISALVATLIPMAPVVWTYASVSRQFGTALSADEVRDESWNLAHTLLPWPSGAQSGPVSLDWPNPGYIATFAAVAGLVILWRAETFRRPWLVMLAVMAAALALALGPWVQIGGWTSPCAGPYLLVDALVGGSLRAPARFLAMAAIGVGWLGGRALHGRPIVAAIASLLALVETRPAPTQSWDAVQVEPAYLALDGLPPGPIFDNAVLGPRSCDARPRHALRAQSRHHRPLVGGTWARKLPAYLEMDAVLARWPAPEAVARVRAAGAVAVFEHPPVQGDDPPGWTCSRPEGHRVCIAPNPPRWEGPAPESVRPVIRQGAAPHSPRRKP
jgi:hypothetical protein